jgi:hypothetical protein
MISTPQSVPELLREKIPDVPRGKYPIRLLAGGIPQGDFDSLLYSITVGSEALARRFAHACFVCCAIAHLRS